MQVNPLNHCALLINLERVIFIKIEMFYCFKIILKKQTYVYRLQMKKLNIIISAALVTHECMQIIYMNTFIDNYQH